MEHVGEVALTIATIQLKKPNNLTKFSSGTVSYWEFRETGWSNMQFTCSKARSLNTYPIFSSSVRKHMW